MSFKKNLEDTNKLSKKQMHSKAEIKDAMETLRQEIKENVKTLTQFQTDLKKYFLRNFRDHLSTKDYINSYSEFIEKADSTLSYNISKISDFIQEEKNKRSILKYKTFWAKNRKKGLDILHIYQSRLNKRIEFEEFINERMSELQNFTDELNNQIINMINEDNLKGAVHLLNDSIKQYDQIVLKHNVEFKEFKSVINREMADAIKFFIDLKTSWINKNNEEKIRWRNFVIETRKKLSTTKESVWKDELEEKIGTYIDNLDNSIDDMKEEISRSMETEDPIKLVMDLKNQCATINQSINNYHNDIKVSIRSSIKDFKTSRESIKDQIEHWQNEKKRITNYLNEIKNELKDEIDNIGIDVKTEELQKLIKMQLDEWKNKVKEFISNYNDFVDTGESLISYEPKFEAEKTQIKKSFKSSALLKAFLKDTSRVYSSFNKIVDTDIQAYKNSRSVIEHNFELITNKIKEEILIQRIQAIVNVIKDNKVGISYLAKALRVDAKALKRKIISLLAEFKLIGELDPVSGMFILKEKKLPNKLEIDEELEEEQILEEEEEEEEEVEEKVEEKIEEKVEKEEDLIKKDILRIRYLMAIHKSVGASVYNRKLGDWKLDPDLIGGFLTAIQSLSTEIKQKEIPIKRMEYKEFEILIEPGEYVFVALFIDGKETDWIREKLKLYVQEFESTFEEKLKNWLGELSAFEKSGLLVDKIFELYRV